MLEMFNPFELPGPQFLVIYVAWSLVILLCTRYCIYLYESNIAISDLDLTDPYEIAYLRGGPNEAIRVAMISLIDRGLMTYSNNNETENYLKASHGAGSLVRKPLEKELLNLYETEQKVSFGMDHPHLLDHLNPYEIELKRHRLIPDDMVGILRITIKLVALAFIAVPAILKITIAMAKHRPNIAFLIILAILATIILFMTNKSRITVQGKRTISDLRYLYQQLFNRRMNITPGGKNAELVLLAAVFGLNAIDPVHFDYVTTLFKKITSQANTTWSNVGCGTCGSFGGLGGSCGTSCGGGGGCGGCGGCGG